MPAKISLNGGTEEDWAKLSKVMRLFKKYEDRAENLAKKVGLSHQRFA